MKKLERYQLRMGNYLNHVYLFIIHRFGLC